MALLVIVLAAEAKAQTNHRVGNVQSAVPGAE
jgi:hypothetical protein